MDYNFPEIARDITALIEKDVAPLLGTEKAHRTAGRSAGGGITKYIDKVAEDAVIAYLKDNDMPCQLVTEEAGLLGENDLKIILDPLDGTINALIGIPFYSVSLAFWGKPRYGFVKNLFTQDIYEAFQGGSPLKNGTKIHPGCPEFVISGYIGEGYQKVLPLIESWRCFGSLALELSYVAEGILAALIDLREKARIVDIAGGQIIAEAAGVVITDTEGNPPFAEGFLNIDGTFAGEKIVCAPPDIHKKILKALHD
jgi:myo-inositol-1(or 4)-monophosphatase